MHDERIKPIPGSLTAVLEDLHASPYVDRALTNAGRLEIQLETIAMQKSYEINMLILLADIDHWIAMIKEDAARLIELRLIEIQKADFDAEERYEERAAELLKELMLIQGMLEHSLLELNKEHVELLRLIEQSTVQIETLQGETSKFDDELDKINSDNYRDLLGKGLEPFKVAVADFNLPSEMTVKDSNNPITVVLESVLKKLIELIENKTFDHDHSEVNVIESHLDSEILKRFKQPTSDKALQCLALIKSSYIYKDTVETILNVVRNNYSNDTRDRVNNIKNLKIEKTIQLTSAIAERKELLVKEADNSIKRENIEVQLRDVVALKEGIGALKAKKTNKKVCFNKVATTKEMAAMFKRSFESNKSQKRPNNDLQFGEATGAEVGQKGTSVRGVSDALKREMEQPVTRRRR